MNPKEPLLPIESRLASKLRSEPASACLSPDMLLELAQHGKQCRDYESRLDHVADCAHCLALLQNLTQIESDHREASVVSLPVAIQRFIRAKSGGVYESARRLPAWSLSLLQQFSDLAMQPAPVYRSSENSSPPAARLLTPSIGNRALEHSPVLFEWEPTSRAKSYDVSIEEAQGCQGRAFRTLPDALIVEGNSAKLRNPLQLQPGYCYRLRIQASMDVDEDWTLNRPESIFLFEMLSPKQVKQALWARAHLHDAKITSAIILYQLGLFEDANQIAQTWETEEELRTWRQRIEMSLEARRQVPSQ